VRAYGEAVLEAQGDADVVKMRLECAGFAIDASVTLNADGKLIGLLFRPAVASEVLPEAANEVEITVDAGTGYPLGGILTVPDGDEPCPAVVLVWGSGASDRNEVVGGNAVFAQLASGLAERGIASLRFDKRTFSYPQIAQKQGFSVYDEYIEDVLAATELLKAQEGIDPARVYIAGHSQGGMLAPRFIEAGADVRGLIVLAGSPRNLSDILYDQEMNVLGDAKDDVAARKLYDDMREAAREVYAGTKEEALESAPLYMGTYPAYYLYEMNQYDAIGLIKAQQTPVLILQGEKDFQVLADGDFSLYQEALSGETRVQMTLFPGLNHLFMPSTATTLLEAMNEYNSASRIPDDVFDEMAQFIMGT
jgi:dienelactone hydrolase